MREYIVESTTVNYKWTFDLMLPSLPGPGTPAFAKLARELHPYGISPAAVSVDAPTSRLGDVTLTILLLNNRVTLTITSSTIELVVRGLLKGDDPSLIAIGDSVFSAVMELEPTANKGSAQIRMSSHLKLAPNNLAEILAEHLAPRKHGLLPETIVNRVMLPEGMTSSTELRLILAKSLAFPDSLFFDLTADYKQMEWTAQIAEWVNNDFEKVAELIGLQERSS